MRSVRRLVVLLVVFALPIAAMSHSRSNRAAPLSTFGAGRPYDPRSPWNTPIGPRPVVDPRSPAMIAAIVDNGLPLSSDVDSYTIPVYGFDANTPLRSVRLAGYFSSYDRGDNSRVGYGFAPVLRRIPIPVGATPSAGSDGHLVIWNPQTGVEYSFWQFGRDRAGGYTATNGYRYHSSAGYSGRFADGKAGRGGGTPYLAGLVRAWEIAQGRIDHALAFAYKSPSPRFTYPASKSDGEGDEGIDVPEGTRLQLDPALTEEDFSRWELRPEARIIARALQRYGMYVIDNGGSSKLYLEDRRTANWDSAIDRHLTEQIPLKRFRVVRRSRARVAQGAGLGRPQP